MNDARARLGHLLNALDSWVRDSGLTPPHYVQREIDAAQALIDAPEPKEP